MSMHHVSSPAQGIPTVQDVPRAAKEDFENAVKAGQRFVLIDSRSGGAYQSSHLDLKGAMRVDPSYAKTQIDQLSIPQGLPIFTICT